jgi:hypothetical protein
MKTYIKYIAIIAVAFGMNSCSKKIIRFKPIDHIYRCCIFITIIDLSMNGMYNAAQDSTTALTQTEEEDMCGVQRSYNREIIEVKML